MGGLSNDDGDGNENGKVVGLDKQKNNFVRASRFFYAALPSLYDYDVKLPNFTFFWRPKHKTTIFFFP